MCLEKQFEECIAEQRELQNEIFNAFPTLSNFRFVGVTFTVNKHISYTHAFTAAGLPALPYTPAEVECIYVDRHNILHWVGFSLEELQSIKEGKPASAVLSTE